MSDEAPEGRHAGAIHSPLLTGLQHDECGLGHCSTAKSTGWLLPGPNGWSVEFDCPEHGLYGVSGGRYRSVVERVLREHRAGEDLARRELASVLRDARALLALPDNDFGWSSWGGADDALREIDALVAAVEAGPLPPRADLSVLFAPTGPVQEVSISSGWQGEYLTLAGRFDAALRRVYG
jgi:hypothetical protein